MTKVTVVNKVVGDEAINHSVGNFYLSDSSTIYVLASVDYRKVCLINTDGSRWDDAKAVVNFSNITPEEFSMITDGQTFTKIESLTITIN